MCKYSACLFICLGGSGPDTPDPKNRPNMAETVGLGPPKNSLAVEPRMKHTKYQPQIHRLAPHHNDVSSGIY